MNHALFNRVPRRLGLGLLLLLAAVLGAGVCLAVVSWLGWPTAVPSSRPVEIHAAAEKTAMPSVIRFAKGKWPAAGVVLQPAEYAPFVERVWRTGVIGLNADRVAHIAPLVEGVVREVPVRLGQDVKAGDVLAVIDSKEVGQAKLELVRSRLALDFATAQRERARTIGANAEALLQALAERMTISDIDRRFSDRDLGEWRKQLVTAYSQLLHTRTRFENVRDLEKAGSISAENFRQIKTDYEAADATFQALREDIKFESRQQIRAAEQKLREADTAQTLTMTHLLMMGFTQKEVEGLNPVAEGQGVSHYPIRAPFAGTIVGKHATLSERVGPDFQMFQLADLSTVWVDADIHEADLALLQGLNGRKVQFRASHDQQVLADAKVFYTGDLVDKATRTVALQAVSDNPDRRLKPGMFIEVQLTRGDGVPVLQIPAAAVQQFENQTFVFVHESGDAFRRVGVSPGRNSGAFVEVTGGLKAGDAVVVQGAFALKSEMLRTLLSED